MIKTKKKYYKVVDCVDGELWSAMHAWLPNPVKYTVGEFAEAPYGGILVFDFYNAALEFPHDNNLIDVRIYEVTCDEPVELMSRSYSIHDEDTFRKNWTRGRKDAYDYWPSHTQAFRKVRLDRCIFPHQTDANNND